MCSTGRRADWDVLSQFESAINDLNTLIKHINSFVDWWGNMTIRLANLEETLPQVKVDENTTFRTDTFKKRWMEVRGEYMSYRRQVIHYYYTSHNALITSMSVDQRGRGVLQRRDWRFGA